MPDKVSFADLPLSEREREMVEAVSKRYGITTDEAASMLVSGALARRIRKRTGKSPARVFQIKPR